MSDPHNINRYGEVWNQEKIDICLSELEYLKDDIILSGGWAWHFISPHNHKELKHAHDHKDIDIFVYPEKTVEVIQTLITRGFHKVSTRFDNPSNKESFRRYVKNVKGTKVIVDFFIKKISYIEIDGWKVVEPSQLIQLYKNIHTSKNCFAVVSAEKLLNKGINILHREELMQPTII